MKDLKPDIVLKNFWQDNERFASLFNTVIFDGKKIIKPEELQEADTSVSNIIGLSKHQETLERSRDVVKRTVHGVDFVILGIENQMNTHYAMPLRVMIYDALGYLKEYQAIARKNKKQDSAAFLSAFGRDDRLHPIISITIYYGEEPWSGPLSLKDMIVDMPIELAEVFSDYKMNLLQLIDSSKYHFDNEDVQTVFEISKGIINKQLADINSKYENRKIKSELAMVIGTITGSEKIVKQAVKHGGEKMSMCKALQELEQEGIEKGIVQGIEQGIEQGRKQGIEQGIEQGRKQGIEQGIEQGHKQGIEQGIEQGRKDERAKIIRQMLKDGFDKNQIEKLTGATSEEIKAVQM